MNIDFRIALPITTKAVCFCHMLNVLKPLRQTMEAQNRLLQFASVLIY